MSAYVKLYKEKSNEQYVTSAKPVPANIRWKKLSKEFLRKNKCHRCRYLTSATIPANKSSHGFTAAAVKGILGAKDSSDI